MSQSQSSAWDRVIQPWWAKLTVGVLMLMFAVWSYNRYSRIESGAEDAPTIVSSGEKVAYDIGGKWLVAGIAVVGGLGFLGWGGYQVSRGNSDARRQ